MEETNALALKPEKATHYIAGIERWVSEAWKAEVEVYAKELDDLIVPEKVQVTRTEWQDGALVETLEDSLTTVPVNDARGHAVGIEFLLEKKQLSEGRRCSGWLSYAWAKASKERDGRTMALDYDQRHTINVETYISRSRIYPLHKRFSLKFGECSVVPQRSRVYGENQRRG